MKKAIAIFMLSIVLITLSACASPTSSYTGTTYAYDTTIPTKKTCEFKENGRKVCSSPAATGSHFCATHTKYLDDAFNAFSNALK